MAISSATARKPHHLRIADKDDNEVGTLDLFSEESSPNADDAVLKKDGPLMQHAWIPVFVPFQSADIIIKSPGAYYISLVSDERSEVIGEVHFYVIDPPPLTPERIAAIRSGPNASQAVRVERGIL